MNNDSYNASQVWQDVLALSGYEHHCQSKKELKKIKKIFGIWKRIIPSSLSEQWSQSLIVIGQK